jgi:hypothetical protein
MGGAEGFAHHPWRAIYDHTDRRSHERRALGVNGRGYSGLFGGGVDGVFEDAPCVAWLNLRWPLSRNVISSMLPRRFRPRPS